MACSFYVSHSVARSLGWPTERDEEGGPRPYAWKNEWKEKDTGGKTRRLELCSQLPVALFCPGPRKQERREKRRGWKPTKPPRRKGK